MFIFGYLILLYTIKRNWLTMSKEYDLRSKLIYYKIFNVILTLKFCWVLTACFQRPTNVEILTIFGRHVFNVLLTLKFWRAFDVNFSMSNWRWFLVVQRRQPNSTYSTLVQRRMSAGLDLHNKRWRNMLAGQTYLWEPVTYHNCRSKILLSLTISSKQLSITIVKEYVYRI